MKYGIAIPLAVALGLAGPAFSLDLNSVLSTVGAGGTGGLIGTGDGIDLDGLALARLGGSTVVDSPTKTPPVSALVLEPPTEEGQIIARVKVGEGLGGDGLDLGGLLGTLSPGDDDDGAGGVVGDLVGTVTGVTGGGDGGTLGGLVGGLGDLGGGGGLVGGLTDTLGDLTGGVLN